MADNSKIEWTDATWNPITGCSMISAGCTNCYAMRLAGTRMKNHKSRAGLTAESNAGPVWNGLVRLNEQWLDQPLKWKRPRRIFVCAHGDLFYESVPDEWIDRVFAVMALSPRHQFQVLTKRAARMRFYLEDTCRLDDINQAIERLENEVGAIGNCVCDCARDDGDIKWPLPNVWLGVSVEDQRAAEERMPHLKESLAAVRFLTIEPLIGPLDRLRLGGIHWVIVGGESGKGARPMHPDWVRSIRDQCAAANVPFFFKQWGDFLPERQLCAEGIDRDDAWMPNPDYENGSFDFGDGTDAYRIGKKEAGRFLDGRTHDEFPRARGTVKSNA